MSDLNITEYVELAPNSFLVEYELNGEVVSYNLTLFTNTELSQRIRDSISNLGLTPISLQQYNINIAEREALVQSEFNDKNGQIQSAKSSLASSKNLQLVSALNSSDWQIVADLIFPS